jgi:pre-rRNA-processing protein IPI3
VSTPTAHLQPVSCIVATKDHLITGSADSNIHVWSLPSLLSTASTETHEPIRSLSNHRAAITSLAIGHGSSNTNIVVSASKDNTCIVWNYATGDPLRTFLLPSTPLCLALDPCDRAVYVGFEDGSVQLVDFFQPNSTLNPLYDTSLQATPVQVAATNWSAPNDVGATQCLAVSYDGTSLLSGHATGKVIRWDTGRRDFSAEIIDLASPVTNLLMVSPLPEKQMSKAVNVVKPRLGETNQTFTAQFTHDLGRSNFGEILRCPGLPSDLLEQAIMEFAKPVQGSSTEEARLRKENEELWEMVNEQRALQNETLQKYQDAKSAMPKA